MQPIERRMFDAWLIASADLDFLLTPAVVLTHPAAPAAQLPFLVHGFGSPRGTLVFASDTDAQALSEVAERAGFHSCRLDPRDFDAYDRRAFIETLKGWGWFGAGAPPKWYNV